MEKKYILAIDQGTTSSRAIAFTKDGNAYASSQREFPQIFPQAGWVEHDPIEIWNSVQNVIAGVLIEGKIQPEEIQAIGITNQRETTVIWDRLTGEPVYNAIVWQSKQSSSVADYWKAQGYSKIVKEKTGLPIDSYFSATKIQWLFEQQPELKERAKKGELLFGTIDTWLLWNLTGGQVHMTDLTNASRTMLFNIHDLTWDQELLDLFDIPSSLLPKVGSNTEIFGYTDASDYLFFGQRIPIAGIAGDQQAALIGQGAFQVGMIKNTYGTGAFILMNTGETAISSEHGLITTIAYQIKNQVIYALEGSIFVAGSAIQWLRDGLELIEDASETKHYCESVKDSENLYVVPAFTGLGAPYWDQEARGAVFGLTRGTNKAHFIRGTVEAIAYQTADVVHTMVQEAKVPITLLKADGGASRNDFLMQFQADILQTTVKRPSFLETTALGAAFLAGLATGFWQNFDEIKGMYQKAETFEPQMPQEVSDNLYEGWQEAVEATMKFKHRPINKK
ncbi:glycerol kinase GlpK [Enterococcus alcedinis]|uniref:Glycerol kinase n=1 Tax=Enterococcus alcedinis TaxID=1274384 RepID=A0A917JCD2_9ENTE|nr:glycerol kinase GlpK [Enterococcus alcedinis]MBP2101103.1 glycerol kinase [Enterococcus alcedinis]GGI64598.1 glycerol kinase [Enterococcus alcedinis]